MTMVSLQMNFTLIRVKLARVEKAKKEVLYIRFSAYDTQISIKRHAGSGGGYVG